MKTVGIAILAAGKGTRLKIDLAKALCPALGRPLIDHVVLAAQNFMQTHKLSGRLTAVVGHKREQVEAHLRDKFTDNISFVWQREQLGTGDALRSYFSESPDNSKYEYTFVACADTPLITGETFAKLWSQLGAQPDVLALAATFKAARPTGYGRILRSEKGFRIVEEKDATPDQRVINEVNSGFYLIRTDYLLKRLAGLNNQNKSGEFYLTDVFCQDAEVTPVIYEDEQIFQGVNDLAQLEEVTRILRHRKLQHTMKEGVLCLDAQSTWLDQDVEVGPGTVLYPGVQIFGKTRIGKNVKIESGAILQDCSIEDSAQILAYSHLSEAVVRTGAQVGPFARLRPASDIGAEAKIGNFVEIKKSTLARGVKVSHLSYVGDAEIGEETNIGCGFVTCNYDGKNKHQTIIGKQVFVGSDVQMIAPVEIGDRSFIAAGSTITKNVPVDAFAIARSTQTIKEGAAIRFLKNKKPL